MSSESQIHLQQISAHVYARVGVANASPLTNSFGANAGAVIGCDAVLVVDTLMSAAQGGQLLSAIRRITDRPIRLCGEHAPSHGPHLGQLRLRCCRRHGHRARIHPPGPARSRQWLGPGATLSHFRREPCRHRDRGAVGDFRQDLRLDLGGVSVELDYPGPTHTAGSIIARIREDDVLFSGDMLFTNYHVTMIDGDVANWCQVLRTLQSTAPRTIIPGHGPISSVADLQAMEEYLRVFDEEATRLCTGKTAADADAIAQELSLRLPSPPRAELPFIVAANLRVRYLPR